MTAKAPRSLELAAYAARETLVSAVINAALSVGFFLLVFGGVDPVPTWGIGNYAFDFVPQSFAIGLMATLVPGFLCRSALIAGRIPGGSPLAIGPGSIVTRALVNGFLAGSVGAGMCAAALWASGLDALASTTAFVLKFAYGALLGAFVTRSSLGRMFG
jgi:hypothetical protein